MKKVTRKMIESIPLLDKWGVSIGRRTFEYDNENKAYGMYKRAVNRYFNEEIIWFYQFRSNGLIKVLESHEPV